MQKRRCASLPRKPALGRRGLTCLRLSKISLTSNNTHRLEGAYELDVDSNLLVGMMMMLCPPSVSVQ